MRKILLVMLTVAACVCMLGGLSACKKEQPAVHTHTFAQEWSSDETYHWHAATCEHTTEKSGRAAHTFSGDVCTVCNYEREHVHEYGEWEYVPGEEPTCTTGGRRMRSCVAGDDVQYEPVEKLGHDWIWTETVPVTCDSDGVRSGVCRRDATHTTTETVPTSGHEFAETWERNARAHWHECVKCHERKEESPHTSENPCGVCGYLLTSTPGLHYTGIDGKREQRVDGYGTAKPQSELVIALEYNNMPVTEVADNAFISTTGRPDGTLISWYKNLQSVVLRENIVRVGARAFYGYQQLADIVLMAPENITYVGEDAFYDTAFYNTQKNWIDGALYLDDILIRVDPLHVGKVTVREGTRLIANGAFAGCSHVTDIELPESLELFGENVIRGCAALASVSITENGKFYSQDGILYQKSGNIRTFLVVPEALAGEVELATGVLSIPAGTFEGREELESVTVPEKTAFISARAFMDCTSLRSAELPSTLTRIEDYAFENCTQLASIRIPAAVEFIGIMAFGGCESLQNVYFEETEGWTGLFGNLSDQEPRELLPGWLEDSETAADCLVGSGGPAIDFTGYALSRKSED